MCENVIIIDFFSPSILPATTYCGLKRPLKGLLSLGLELLDSSLLLVLTFSLCRTVIALKKQYFKLSKKGSKKASKNFLLTLLTNRYWQKQSYIRL